MSSSSDEVLRGDHCYSRTGKGHRLVSVPSGYEGTPRRIASGKLPEAGAKVPTVVLAALEDVVFEHSAVLYYRIYS